MAAPVRGARILLTDDRGVRADMTASWLAQMGWEVYVLDGGYDGALEAGPPEILPKPDPAHRYRRPYEGTDVDASAMQAYLDWEYGLVEQLRRDATPRVLRDLRRLDRNIADAILHMSESFNFAIQAITTLGVVRPAKTT